jgi:hypothetical protein
MNTAYANIHQHINLQGKHIQICYLYLNNNLFGSFRTGDWFISQLLDTFNFILKSEVERTKMPFSLAGFDQNPDLIQVNLFVEQLNSELNKQ